MLVAILSILVLILYIIVIINLIIQRNIIQSTLDILDVLNRMNE